MHNRPFTGSRRVSILLAALILCNSRLAAQTAGGETYSVPVPVETMAGNSRFTLQTLINRKFAAESRLNFLSVTSAASGYTNNSADFDFINTSQIGIEMYKGIGFAGGISLNAKTGFNPTAGLEYALTRQTLLLVIAPDIYLSNDHNLEAISVIEYKPRFTDHWSLYTRLQSFFNYNVQKRQHDRSYIDFRIGPAYGSFAFGIGANLDWYGPSKLDKQNYGLFLRYSFH